MIFDNKVAQNVQKNKQAFFSNSKLLTFLTVAANNLSFVNIAKNWILFLLQKLMAHEYFLKAKNIFIYTTALQCFYSWSNFHKKKLNQNRQKTLKICYLPSIGQSEAFLHIGQCCTNAIVSKSCEAPRPPRISRPPSTPKNFWSILLQCSGTLSM